MYWSFAPFSATSSTTALCKRGGVELRRGAAFHVGQLRAFVADDERALELAEVLGVDPEVSLERMFHLHSRRDVNE